MLCATFGEIHFIPDDWAPQLRLNPHIQEDKMEERRKQAILVSNVRHQDAFKGCFSASCIQIEQGAQNEDHKRDRAVLVGLDEQVQKTPVAYIA